MDTVLTPTAEWRQRDDGTWEFTRLASGSSAAADGGPGPGGSFGPTDIDSDDNVLVVQVPGGVVIRRGGHAILYETVELPWRPELDFVGSGVQVTDDATNNRTTVYVPGVSQDGLMRWRDAYDADAAYVPGDVVYDGDWTFVFIGPPFFLGWGAGLWGEDSWGEPVPAVGGFGGEGFGEGGWG